MSAPFVSAFVMVAIAAQPLSAAVGGAYKRVGDWKPQVMPGASSCGADASRTLQARVARISAIRVGKGKLSFGRAVKPLAIVERTKTSVEAEGGEGGDTILKVSLIETDKGTMAMFTRMYVADISAPCADTFSVYVTR